MGNAEEEFVVAIVGAGPAGLAADVHINKENDKWVENERAKDPKKYIQPVKTIIIEKDDVTAPLWRKYTYDNLTLQCTIPKCQLPHQDFHADCPEFPRRADFIKYLDKYEKKLKSELHFNEEVTEAEYERDAKKWKITTKGTTGQSPETKTYYCDFLVVASGLNAVPKIPDLPGLAEHFPLGTLLDPKNLDSSPMKQIHVRDYKNGKKYEGKKVLVVGYGDSGIDICGDLRNALATPYIVVRKSQRTEKFYEKAPKEEDGRIKLPFETNLSELSKAVGNRGQCKYGNIDKECSRTAYACSDIDHFEKNSVYISGLDAPLDIDCVILATGYDHSANTWLKDAKITIKEIGDMQFDDALKSKNMLPPDSKIGEINDATLCDNTITATGFNSIRGLHGLKTEVEEIYEQFEEVA